MEAKLGEVWNTSWFLLNSREMHLSFKYYAANNDTISLLLLVNSGIAFALLPRAYASERSEASCDAASNFNHPFDWSHCNKLQESENYLTASDCSFRRGKFCKYRCKTLAKLSWPLLLQILRSIFIKRLHCMLLRRCGPSWLINSGQRRVCPSLQLVPLKNLFAKLGLKSVENKLSANDSGLPHEEFLMLLITPDALLYPFMLQLACDMNPDLQYNVQKHFRSIIVLWWWCNLSKTKISAG